MKCLGLLALVAIVFSGTANAKHYATCDAAFQFYLKDGKPHKAFATTNGTFPGHGNMVCGGSGGNDLGAAIYAALTRCAAEARKSHYSGKCQVIRKQ